MASNVDIRIDTTNAEFSEDGLYKHYILSRRIDVPALIAAGTLAATGLVATNTYYVFNLPKYCIVKGAFLFVRTVESVGPTGTITIYCNSQAMTGAQLLTSLGTITDASGAGFTIADIAAYNTGIGTDMVKVLASTANITTAIFDVCVEVLRGAQPYNAGSLAGSTGQ